MDHSDDHHCFRADPLVRWQHIADVLETSSAAWVWALGNIDRWLQAGRLHSTALHEWRQILTVAQTSDQRRHELLATLREPPADAWSEQLRSCAPFVGGPFDRKSPVAANFAA